MANKKITDLDLRSDFDTTCNIPVDDSSQTWRVTGTQVLSFMQSSFAFVGASFAGSDTTAVLSSSERKIGQSGTELYDSDNALSSGTFTVPAGKSGKYRVGGACAFAALASSGAACSLRFKKNGATIHGVSNTLDGGTGSSIEVITISGNCTIAATAGDTLEVFVFQDNAATSSRAMTNAHASHSDLQWIQFEKIG